jgi:hypothetical protein
MATDMVESPPENKVAPKTKGAPAARQQRPSASARPGGTVVPLMKKICWGVFGVAALMTLLFLLDLFLSFPFAGASTALDIFGILAGAIVLYLSWDSAREIR